MSAGKADMQAPVLEKCFQVFNCGLRVMEEPIELFSELFARNTGNILDSYLDQRIGIQLDCDVGFGRSSLHLEREKLCFVFKKIGGERLDSGDSARRRDGELQPRIGRNGNDNMKPPVSIFPGTVMQQLEASDECGVRGFSNVVGLYRLKPVPQLLREWSLVDGVSFEIVRHGTDGKFNSALIGGISEAARQYRRLVDGSIERGPELIKHLAQLKSEVIFGPGFRRDDPSDAPCPVAIHLYDNLVGFWIDKSSPLNLKSFRVLNGPVETLPTVSK